MTVSILKVTDSKKAHTKTTDIHTPDCPIRSILDRIGDKWGVQLIHTLSTGDKRFNELRRQIEGISQRMLTETLRKLERDGLVSRTVYASKPPTVEYALTDMGHSLVPIICNMVQWSKQHADKIIAARQRYDETLG